MRKAKDNVIKTILYLSAFITVAIVAVIIGYVFKKGIGLISLDFIFGDYSASTGGGVFPMVITTVLTVLVSLVIAVPIGIGGAVFLSEYARQGRFVRIVRYAIDTLAGIPSIIYGLFGSVFFVTAMNLGFSVIAGSLTLAIIVLPVIISTTEESLKAVPQSYREAAVALGSTKFELLYKIVLPAALPGILSGVILSMGRIIGESAALILTLGTVASMPNSIMSSGRTLTIHSYLAAKESGDIQLASATGIVLIVMILILNLTAKALSSRIVNKRLK